MKRTSAVQEDDYLCCCKLCKLGAKTLGLPNTRITVMTPTRWIFRQLAAYYLLGKLFPGETWFRREWQTL